MTNEAIKVELYGANNDGQIRSYVVASSATFNKGTMLSLADGRVAAASVAAKDSISGFANAQKSADYSVTIGAWTQGVFSLVASEAITFGAEVVSASDANFPNTVMVNPLFLAATSGAFQCSGAQVIGYALDSVADTERVNIRVNL